MKKIFLFLLLQQLCSFASKAQYDENYVLTSFERIRGELYSVVQATRKGERVKVKYFADKDQAGKSVYNRYMEWSRNKSIIAVSSGTYFDQNDHPVGICIDDGYTVNNTQVDNMDALVIVYKTGGIVVSDLDEGNLTVQSPSGSMALNLRNNFDRSRFFSWSRDNSATVFQTHLMYFKNTLRVGTNADRSLRERRMLAVTRDEEGAVNYFLVNLKASQGGGNTLYNATQKIVEFLKSYTSEIIFLINLDVGAQDIYMVKEPNGKTKSAEGFSGTVPLSEAKNLLVFYFE